MSRLKQKDKDAFIKTYDLYADDIHRFVYFKIGGKPEEANDLTSIIFLKAWDYLRQNKLRDAKTLRALLYKIARTSIVDYYRQHQNQKTVSIDDEEHPVEITDDSQDLLQRLSVNSDLELIRKKLPELKIEYREVIVMRYINDLSLDEIADITGKKKVNVRVLLFRALKALRESIEQ
jgi:RNA polymerase sigma-70 factor (ECF subfamily)